MKTEKNLWKQRVHLSCYASLHFALNTFQHFYGWFISSVLMQLLPHFLYTRINTFTSDNNVESGNYCRMTIFT